MSTWYRSAALSDSPFFRFLRNSRRAVLRFSVPAPKVLTVPALSLVLAVRELYYFVVRVFICEPLFKGYVTSHGRNFHTGVFLHWVQGRGRFVFGDNVIIDGKCSFTFAARYSENPTLEIGDNSGVGHDCTFIVGKRITIGKHCRLANQIYMFDSPGHPMDAQARMAGQPASAEDVREIVVGDNVWIGTRAVIYPGVKIGEGAVIATGAVVMADVPPYTLVAGNPARQLKSIAAKA
jgi:acetyltransferase-like isoleucine patch superfamily enzyme